MHWITRTAATVATAFALALPSVGVAQAGSAPAPTSTTTVAAATCHYTVARHDLPVRESPNRNSRVIKYKDRDAPVSGPCNTEYNDGRDWTEVYLAEGGTGWMNSDFLVRR